ncbi:MAG: translesion error-prone DNA polymerase V autoproteolytic subunit [Pseudomonadales bacterium]|nr:translesion error-prone DNA polymerase V autoproteolytic subunit [Pseudomonadales bacterium]
MKIKPLALTDLPSILELPVYLSQVSAGFPSPADDYIEETIDLNKHIIKRPSSTYFARASGDSMLHLGIISGDLLVIDRSVTPKHGAVVVAAVNGELTCKILDKHRKMLLAANKKYPPIAITPEMELLIEGVVTHSVRYHHVVDVSCMP